MAETLSKYVKFRRGTPEAYQSLTNKDSDTLYFIYENDELTGELYLGSKLIAGAKEGNKITSLENLADVLLNLNESLNSNECLVYDISLNKWVNKPIMDIVDTFIGANSTSSGVPGLVPAAPAAGETGLFLRSDGTWVDTKSLILQATLTTGETYDQAIIKAFENIQRLPISGDIVIIKNLEKQTVTHIFNGEKWLILNEVDLSNYASNDKIDEIKNITDELEGKISNIESNIDGINTNINSISTKLLEKADIVYYSKEDDETGEIIQVPGSFLSPEDKEKLEALVLDESGSVGISGKVSAGNVSGLGTWITDHGSTFITNLNENNLSSALNNKINFITSVDVNNFSVVDGQLLLGNIEQSKIQGLSSSLREKASQSEVTEISEVVGNLNNIINGYVDNEGTSVQGLVSQVGDLKSLLNSKEEALSARLSDVETALIWQELEEINNN